MKTNRIITGCVIFILLFSVLMTINIKAGYTTLIRIENKEQHDYIIKGKEPNISFVSLRDTPCDDKVKILKINYHTTVEHLLSDQVIDDWLGGCGIRHYPELVGMR